MEPWYVLCFPVSEYLLKIYRHKFMSSDIPSVLSHMSSEEPRITQRSRFRKCLDFLRPTSALKALYIQDNTHSNDKTHLQDFSCQFNSASSS